MLRYLGKKAGIVSAILDALKGPEIGKVVEPFAGSMQMSKEALHRGLVGGAVAADKNPILHNVWRAILENPDKFAHDVNTILSGLPTTRMYNRPNRLAPEGVQVLKALDSFEPNNLFDTAVKDYTVNAVAQRSRPGITALINPGEYVPSPKLIRSDIKKTYDVLSKGEIFDNWSSAVNQVNADDMLYIDPPYLGTIGYKGGFSIPEQNKLIEFIRSEVGRPKLGFVFNSPEGAKKLDFLKWKQLNPGESVAQFGQQTIRSSRF